MKTRTELLEALLCEVRAAGANGEWYAREHRIRDVIDQIDALGSEIPQQIEVDVAGSSQTLVEYVDDHIEIELGGFYGQYRKSYVGERGLVTIHLFVAGAVTTFFVTKAQSVPMESTFDLVRALEKRLGITGKFVLDPNSYPRSGAL